MNNRIKGLFMGQLVGDAVGTRYEFMRSSDVHEKVTKDMTNYEKKTASKFLPMMGGGPFNVNSGQYTDDSELALGIWYSLTKRNQYDREDISKMFYLWHNSAPFDCGRATSHAFNNGYTYDKMKQNAIRYNSGSLSNGCLMKISPLGILNVLYNINFESMLNCVGEICELTNPHIVCVDMCRTYVAAVHTCLVTGNAIKAYETAKNMAELKFTELILNDAKMTNNNVKLLEMNGKDRFKTAVTDGPSQGYIGIGFQNAFHQLLNITPSTGGFYKVIINTVLLGGDTDTNACIAGALYGACYGLDNIPDLWKENVTEYVNSVIRTKKYQPLDHMNIFHKLCDLLNCD